MRQIGRWDRVYLQAALSIPMKLPTIINAAIAR